jgi:hypothetical protein
MSQYFSTRYGRKIRSPYADIINAQAPSVLERKRLSDSLALQEQQIASDEAVRRQQLEQVRLNNEKRYALQTEAAGIAKKEADRAAVINSAGVAVQAAPLAYKGVQSVINAPEAAKASGTAGTSGGTGELSAGKSAGTAETSGGTGGLSAGNYGQIGAGLGAAAIGVARKPINTKIREKYGEDTGKAADLQADIGQGALIGTSIYPGWGSLIGAAVGFEKGTYTAGAGNPSEKDAIRDLNISAATGIPMSGIGLIKQSGVLEDIENFVKDPCIIVTVCTSADSLAVDICRLYRDKFMSREHLRGYYMIAEAAVPVLKRSASLRRLVKRQLVERWVDYAVWSFHQKTSVFGWCPGGITRAVSVGFLGLCRVLGRMRPSFKRSSGEAV